MSGFYSCRPVVALGANKNGLAANNVLVANTTTKAIIASLKTTIEPVIASSVSALIDMIMSPWGKSDSVFYAADFRPHFRLLGTAISISFGSSSTRPFIISI